MKNYLLLLRPKHWIKNLFIFCPLFFAGRIFDFHSLYLCILGFLSFSLIASSIYIINDMQDIEADRLHPKKRFRPLASGAISQNAAIFIFASCLVVGLIIALLIKPKFLFVVSIYLVLNGFYSFGLKNISILDIFIVAIGFVLRIKAGGVLADVAISHWLMIMVFLLALFMAIAKRRDDILLQQISGIQMRKSISGYNLEFLNTCLSLISAVIIVSYIMYTVAPETIAHMGTYRLYYTAIFVIAGLMRYLQLIYIKNDSSNPTNILYKDRFLQGTLILWVISFYMIIYVPNFTIF